jgi:hypothetical protein
MASSAPEFPPYDPLGKRLNERFHSMYQERLAQLVLTFGAAGGRPVVLALNDDLVLMKDGQRQDVIVRPDSYHQLKALGHAYFARLLGAEDPELPELTEQYLLQVGGHLPLEARAIAEQIPSTLRPEAPPREVGALMEQAFAQAARIELYLLHQRVSPWWEALSEDEQSRCGIVVVSSHQSRAERLNVQYFEALTGRRSGPGALHEDGFLVLEGDIHADDALLHLARHYLDQEVAEQMFGDRFRLQIDLLAPGARQMIPELLNGGL